MGKEDVVCIYIYIFFSPSEVLFNQKHVAIWDNMNGLWRYYAK